MKCLGPALLALALGSIHQAVQEDVVEAPVVLGEHFVLETEDGVIALSRLVQRLEPERRVLEWETRFLEGPRAMLIETETAGSRRLVWREVGAQAPTWMVEAGARTEGGGTVRETRWGLGVEPHRSYRSEEPLDFPLDLLQDARGGGILPGKCLVAQPLELGFGHRSMESIPLPDETWAENADRVVRMRDSDDPEDPAAWSFALAGERLIAFRLRADGPWWQQVSPGEYTRLHDRGRRIRNGAAIEKAK